MAQRSGWLREIELGVGECFGEGVGKVGFCGLGSHGL